MVVVVNVGDRDRQLDLLEEAALDMEDEPVLARLESLRELRDASVLVGLLERDEVLGRDRGRPSSLPQARQARCRGRGSRSWRESSRLDPMVPRDLLLVRPHEPAVADDLFAADIEPVDAVRGRQDEAGDRGRRRRRARARPCARPRCRRACPARASRCRPAGARPRRRACRAAARRGRSAPPGRRARARRAAPA